jgi:hypothetical protein
MSRQVLQLSLAVMLISVAFAGCVDDCTERQRSFRIAGTIDAGDLPPGPVSISFFEDGSVRCEEPGIESLRTPGYLIGHIQQEAPGAFEANVTVTFPHDQPPGIIVLVHMDEGSDAPCDGAVLTLEPADHLDLRIELVPGYCVGLQ